MKSVSSAITARGLAADQSPDSEKKLYCVLLILYILLLLLLLLLLLYLLSY